MGRVEVIYPSPHEEDGLDVEYFYFLFIYFLHCLLSIVRTASLLYYGVLREVDVA